MPEGMNLPLVLYECSVCHRGEICSILQMPRFIINLFTGQEYCPDHKPQPFVLTPENIERTLKQVQNKIQDIIPPDGGQTN
jgi:hypothetical protein